MTGSAHGPLPRFRVLELGSTIAGPLFGRLLADFGAEVIKVEELSGDTLRGIGKRFHGKSLYAASLFRTHIRAGRLKAMAVTTAKHLPALPNVPTVAEQGYPGYDIYEWYGIFAPGKTPPVVVEKLSREVARLLRQPDIAERIAVLGAEPQGSTPAEFGKFVRAEMERWGALASRIGLKPD
jgi:tripartite-type tricarboxylate transporter receptor subunit TctC